MSEAVLEATRTKRDKAQKKIDSLVADAEKRDDKTLTDDEQTEFDGLVAEVRKLDKRAKKLIEVETRQAKADKAFAKVIDARQGPAVVRSEPGVYRRDAFVGAGEPSYLRDLAAAMVPHASSLGIHPEDARSRLAQNYKEIERDAESGDQKQFASRIVDEVRRWGDAPDVEARVNPNTTAGTGGEFVPPLWLVSQYEPFRRPGRVIANRVPTSPLPPGIGVINVPKITTGSATAIQTANAAAVTSTDIVTTSVSASVNTIAGQEDISLQLLEQSPLAMDNVVFDDLSRDYDQRLDLQVISGSGASGQHQGVLSQTGATSNTDITKINLVTCGSTVFADASTTGTQFRSIVAGKNFIETLRFAGATALWVHPRRANNWEATAFDTTGRPLFVPYAPFNAFGIETLNVAEGVAGVLVGLPVIKDANMPTACVTSAITGGTGDAIAVVKEDDLQLWEGTVRMRALPEILSGTLQIRFQLYAYSAFLPKRFQASTSLVTGTTGLAAPTF